MSDFMRWVTHGIKRGRFELSSRAALYLFAPLALLTAVAALYLTLVSRTAARGRYIEQLRVELFRLQRDNEQMGVQLAGEASVSRLWERSVEPGFVPAERIEFLRPVPAGVQD